MNITIPYGGSSELLVKKSKFIVNIFYIDTKEKAEEKIKNIKKKYYDASHNCSAYRVIENDVIIEKSSDDGEPSGTAGTPMLNILQKNNLCNILAVVTRYFGGTLLGTGGLIRAYSDALIRAIQEADKTEISIGKQYEVKVDYSNFEKLKYYCKKNNINILKIEYLKEIICNLEVDENFVTYFLKDIKKRAINILDYKLICDKKIKIGKNFQKTIAF